MPSPPHVGCLRLEVHDPVQGAPIPTHLLYPTDAPPRTERFGPYRLDVAMDGPARAARAPLVIISHGTGGSPWPYRGLACHLARAGFAVALPLHPGNNHADDALAGTAALLVHRPRNLRRVIDAVAAHPRFGAGIAERAVIVGHSMGGYTALALAGGRPWCSPREAVDGKPVPMEVEPDPRVVALVLLAPATPWYMGDGALSAVEVPILMRTGEADEYAPPWHGEIVLKGVPHPERVDHRVVPGAGHFAFQSPFPREMCRPGFIPALDPPDFDRAAYQPVLYREVEAFVAEQG